MGAHTVILFGTWTLRPDQEPDAEPVTYAMRCAVCGAGSEASTDFSEPQSWVFRHVGRNPSHHTFQEVIVRPWRAWMRR
ncbi:hypothetical protein [Streptomyces sp. NPDC002994]|uniref:DUF7848 domain-containing protein n=1 Tax=Streptomyces sp. NPDC002994 TaxID=3154441 RepID=UPI0033AF8E37